MELGKSVPVARQPADVMRYGLSSMEQQATAGHPVEYMQAGRIKGEFEFKLDTVQRIYGSGFAMRLKTEAAMLSQVQRLPGLPSSNVGLETLLGLDETIDFEDVLGLPEDRPAEPRFKIHEAMEIKYGFM
jgi:proteasome maturation protein